MIISLKYVEFLSALILVEQVSCQHHHPKNFQSFASHKGASGAAQSARTLASKWPFEIPERGGENPFDSFTSKDHTPEFKQDPTSASYLAGRAGNEELPACVKLTDSFETDSNGYLTFRAYEVPVQAENPFLSCKATGAGNGEFELDMYAGEDDGTYCSNYNYLTETYECSVGGGPKAFVDIVIYYAGLPTTITITCSNEPCTDPVCGDGFCSNELETPLSPGGATGTTCQEDCGKTCGDGICDSDVGENDSNCLSDCGCLYLNEKVNLDFAETISFEIEVADGESVECFSPSAFFNLGVILNYDDPPCLNFDDFDYPTPSPTASRSPSTTSAPTPCSLFGNDCVSADYCSVGPAVGSQTLYVYVEGIYDFFMGDFICQRPKTECSFTEAPTSAPVKAPTKAPVKAPTKMPVKAPTPAPWFCFSKFTEVEVLGQGLTHMVALKIGDAVRTADGSFSTVYSFGHYDPHTVANFLQLWTDASNEPLEITGDHLLFVKPGVIDDGTKLKVLPATAVKVGDLLVAPQQQGSSSDAVVKVTAITTVQREGLYAPFTTTGNIVVNGVTASNYIALPPTFQAVTSFESQHWLQHLAYLPYRLYCGTAGCQNETYHGETGLSGAVTLWLPLLHWVEASLSWSWSVHGVAVALVYLVWKQQQSTHHVIVKN